MKAYRTLILALLAGLVLAGCGDIGELTVDEAVEKAWGTVDDLHDAAVEHWDSATGTAEDTVDTINDLKQSISEHSERIEKAVNALKEGDFSGLDQLDLTDYENFKVDAGTFVSSFSRILAAGHVIESRKDELGTAYIYTFEGKDGSPQNVIVVCSDKNQIAAISISRQIRDLNEIAGYVMDAAGIETNVDFQKLMDGLPEEATFEKNGYIFAITDDYITITMAAA